MLTNQYYYSKFYKFLATSCLVLLAVIGIFAGSTSWAMAQELSQASGMAGKIQPNFSEDRSQAVEETQFTFEPKSGILAEVNQKFHEDYDRLIAQITSTFGKSGGPTVLVFTMNKLILYHDGKREEQQFIPSLYHQLKAIEHHPLTLYATLQAYEGQKLTNSLRDFLGERSNLLQKALRSLNEESWPQNIVNNQKALLTDSIEYINQVLAEKHINSDKLNNYVQRVIPNIVKGVNSAAAEELELINEKMKKLLAKEKWQSPYVVICSVHQARHGEVVTQYFERVFNEFQGDAAEREDRIVYAESILDDEPKALRLLATHILDRKLGSAFFRDPRRLQSDALRDAANFWLWENTMNIPKWDKKY
ncbi:hypothetical protein [Allocoleopsis franciscana]|uniref:Uncharacterized protein n=1 Tax=Allocoleopsis franciscana PCC 7113 TaxID=1173027 RepID=K9WDG0_9CYAN|nr:hypothetical protein [Allocoleopsis franciscana]AFZ18435.1 hypothetical protein Mic7113_2647 [Allocoleopsis franciscana PCC 7113]